MPDGVINWWNPERGFGFIGRDGGGDDLFFHISDVHQALQSEIAIGRQVEFEEGVNPRNKRPLAVNVRAFSQEMAGNGLQSAPAQDHEERDDGIGNRDGPQPVPAWLARETRTADVMSFKRDRRLS